MNNFTFCSPTEFVFGRGVTDTVGGTLREHDFTRALVVYGQGSVVRTGTLERVLKSLDDAGIQHVELGGVRPNPEVSTVRAGIELALEHDVDVVLPVGGGSAMDCAKAVALGAKYAGDVWDFFCKKAQPTDHIPVAAIVTMPASGSEASDSCVISNDDLGQKCGVNTGMNRPVIAFMDPELTFTLPAYQTAAGAVDMISHICERFFSGEPAVTVTDNVAAGLIRAVMEEAPKILADPQDYEARANIMWAGTLAHNGLAGCGLGIPGLRDGDWSCHALEHELSALDPKITHGAGLAVITPAWMRYVEKAHPERFLDFGRLVFGIEPVDPTVDDLNRIEEEITPERARQDAVDATIGELSAFFASIGMPTTLGDLGIGEDDLDALVAGLKKTKGESFGTFMRLTPETSREIYASAL